MSDLKPQYFFHVKAPKTLERHELVCWSSRIIQNFPNKCRVILSEDNGPTILTVAYYAIAEKDVAKQVDKLKKEFELTAGTIVSSVSEKAKDTV
jgi:hypothetical protein